MPWAAGLRLAVTVCAAVMASPAAGDVIREEMEPILRLDLPGHTGEVRALAFSPDGTRLVSGGRDKVAFVWSLPQADAGAASGGAVVRERSLRWQVGRGTRGAIQAIAVAPGAVPVVALAGSGALGSSGEILLLRADDGTLVKALGGADRAGHRSSVAALDFTTDGRWLVSRDLDGEVLAWDRDAQWAPVPVSPREETRHGPDAAAALRRFPATRPVAALGRDRAVFGTVVGDAAAPTPIWRLVVVALAREPRTVRTLPVDHVGGVSALSATPDGSRIASTDLGGTVTVSDTDGERPPSVWSLADADAARKVAESLAISPDGTRLAVGVAGTEPRLEVWDAVAARRLVTRPVTAPVRAVRVAADGGRVAWTGRAGRAIEVAALATLTADSPTLALGGIGRRITRVAFGLPGAAVAPPARRDIVRRRPVAEPSTAPTRLAIATAEAADAPWEAAFDVGRLAPVAPAGPWAEPAGAAAGWRLVRASPDEGAPPGVQRWRLSRGGAPAACIDLALDWEGVATGNAVAWLTRPGADGPWAVAIGTDRGISVYRVEADPARRCALVRRFRGHEDAVLALAIAPDGGWLASGGGDGLVMLWSLAGLDAAVPLVDRWGIECAVRDGRAVVTAVEAAGPLAGRDVRVGDVITAVSWSDGAAAREARGDAAAIVAALGEAPWSRQVAFSTARGGMAGEVFQRYPAWENVASLHLGADREWAMWTPRGYYAASANGDTRFGWLVNRGLDRLPRFFRAQQFRRRLERPDVVGRLLVAGSVDAALRASDHDVPDSSALVLPRQIAAAPAVRIVAPRAGAVARDGGVAVIAEVELPADGAVERVTASASGVVCAVPPRVEELPAEGVAPRRLRFEWDRVGLPRGDRHLVQVFAGTREGPTGAEAVTIVAPGDARPERPGRLFFLGAGVDRYPKARMASAFEFPDLAYAVGDARAVRAAFTGRTTGLWSVRFDRFLADAEVTRSAFESATRELEDRLDDGVGPDDLVVLFLAGHGLVNGGPRRDYVFLCHDAAVDADSAGRPLVAAPGTIGWRDLAILAGVPCRKVAIIDTCHAGALGPGVRGSVVREFQEHQIVVLAAAADDEPSLEDEAWGHGAFTKSLLEAIDGRADGYGAAAADGSTAADGVVALDEIVGYVVTRVPELTRERGGAQHPTVSPAALVPYVGLPLARADGVVSAVRVSGSGEPTAGGRPAPAPPR